MNQVEKQLDQQISDAIKAMDISALDLLLRTEMHYNARGRAIDTSSIKFVEVLKLDPKFYG